MTKRSNHQKPYWLDKKVNLSVCRQIKQKMRGFKLHTVCEESLCPNISECFMRDTATFMILGNICTRNCAFCSVNKGKPLGIDSDEPKRVATAVKDMGLKYVVITSPTRDDLSDGGAAIFAETVREIKKISDNIKVELLVPDFQGNKEAIDKVVLSGCDVLGHNLETAAALYPFVRKGADYDRSLNLLNYIKERDSGILTKSSIMLGLGETVEEIQLLMNDLRTVKCDLFAAGQYLSPSIYTYKVKEYIVPETFDAIEKYAYEIGFLASKCAPYVRSSYLADSFISSKK
ncbi:MAG: lipoyl synthase [Candidatus Omnitrophica bacterium]|nr:lipoyl synthase [Candidatus Omnitrophota bacterium]MDD5080465.1 lipoyl synthase [Candidatus Omnitrophota bacterium]MDD5440858.1 lipoyl synthase [Candidatus Omnitrophota bacterium]